jgi:hypothetical protein
MDEFLDAVTGGFIWGTGFTLGMMAVRSAGTTWRPIARRTMRGAAAAGSWMRSAADESRETLQDMYAEAQAERQAATPQTSPS